MKRMFILALLFSAPLYATDYFVAVTGSDSNTGTNSAPFKTIQKAINTASSGDTIRVSAGTYHEDTANNPGFNTPAKGLVVSTPNLTFIADAGVLLDQCNVTTRPCPKDNTSRSGGFLIRTGTHNVIIDGFEITNVNTAGVEVTSSPGESYTNGLVVRNSHIHEVWGADNTGAIRPDVTDGAVFENNRLHDITYGGQNGAVNSSGVHSYYMKNATIRGNEIYAVYNGIRDKGPDHSACVLTAPMSCPLMPNGNVVITGNSIHDVDFGIRIGGHTDTDVAHNHVITRNIIAGATACVRIGADLVSPSDYMTITDNTFDNCGGIQLDYTYPHLTVSNNGNTPPPPTPIVYKVSPNGVYLTRPAKMLKAGVLIDPVFDVGTVCKPEVAFKTSTTEYHEVTQNGVTALVACKQ